MSFVGPVLRAAISGAAANNELVAAVAGKSIRVISAHFVASGGANTVRLESSSGGDALTGAMDLAADGQLDMPYNPAGHIETVAAENLNMELSAATLVAGWLTYVLVD